MTHWAPPNPSPTPSRPPPPAAPLILIDQPPHMRLPTHTVTHVPPERTTDTPQQSGPSALKTVLHPGRVSAGERGGQGGKRKGEGKKRVKQRPDTERPVRRKKTELDRAPVTKRKRTKPIDPNVSEPPHRKHKKSSQQLMSTFLRT